MKTMTSCNTSDLSVYVPSASNPWNAEKVSHVYRRLHFGASTNEITSALGETPENLINNLVNAAVNTNTTTTPPWSLMTYDDFTNAGLDPDEEIQKGHRELKLDFFNRFLNNGLHSRLTLFWSNHFVTQLESYYCSSFLWEYYATLQNNALGNFKDFVRTIGTTNAMLVYLNGLENASYAPNENYARELYELFTLGVNNGYTQTDIVETAKALTGYNGYNGFCAAFNFEPNSFNDTTKTIFNQVGNWGYDDVIDILFQEKAPLIASFICKKLYTYFVSPTVNDTIVQDMANIFVQDFDLANILRVLFKSKHFFDSFSIGTQIKSPFDLTINFLKTTGFTVNDDFKGSLIYLNGVAGQRLFDPVDVAGWQGDHDWINSSTLTGRWGFMQYMINTIYNESPEDIRNFAISVSGDSKDPYFITKSIIDLFSPKELYTTTDYNIATDIFKADVPQNYYDDGSWSLYWGSAPNQIYLLLTHINRIPEFQLK